MRRATRTIEESDLRSTRCDLGRPLSATGVYLGIDDRTQDRAVVTS